MKEEVKAVAVAAARAVTVIERFIVDG